MALRDLRRTRRSKSPVRLLVILAVVMAFFAAVPGIAHAHHKDGHDGGPPSSEDASGEGRGRGSDGADGRRTDDSDSTQGSDSSDGSDRSDESGQPSNRSGKAGSNSHGGPTQGCAQAQENDGDPYDSTCDGSPSRNGNESRGDRPCAGCVGAADNKNPRGQMPNGSDPNNGYECDGNQGIGQTNPAHSGCQGSQSQMTIAVTCFTATVISSKDISFVEVVFADGGIAKFEGLIGTQFSRTFGEPLFSAQAKSGTTIVSDTVDEVCVVPPGPPGPEVRADRVLPRVILPTPEERGRRDEPPGAVLPFTGMNPFRYLELSWLLMMIGAVFMAYPMRRRAR